MTPGSTTPGPRSSPPSRWPRPASRRRPTTTSEAQRRPGRPGPPGRRGSRAQALTPPTEHVLLVGDSILRQTGPALTRQLGDELHGAQRRRQRLRPADPGDLRLVRPARAGPGPDRPRHRRLPLHRELHRRPRRVLDHGGGRRDPGHRLGRLRPGVGPAGRCGHGGDRRDGRRGRAGPPAADAQRRAPGRGRHAPGRVRAGGRDWPFVRLVDAADAVGGPERRVGRPAPRQRTAARSTSGSPTPSTSPSTASASWPASSSPVVPGPPPRSGLRSHGVQRSGRGRRRCRWP